MRQTICKNNRKLFVTDLKPKMYFKKLNILKQINSALSENRQSSIDFNTTLLQNLDNDNINLLKLHTVAIYGRTFNKKDNQCYYLLKDSHGDKCNRYDSRIECDKGYLWLPEKSLIKASTSAVVFK